MSEEPTSALTRLVPGFALIALVAMISAAAFHVATLEAPKAPAFSRADSPDAPDFAQTGAWYALPETKPEGGWERPWGVDLFWLADQETKFSGGWNSPIDWAGSDPEGNWLDLLPANTANYAPKRRYANALTGAAEDYAAAQRLEAEDVNTAFDVYANEYQQMRGFFIGGHGAGADLALTLVKERISDTRAYNHIFGGLIVISEDSRPHAAPTALPPCDTSAAFPCFLDLSKTAEDQRANVISDLAERFSVWLDANAPKPAAPLPPIETISLSPINQVDGQ